MNAKQTLPRVADQSALSAATASVQAPEPISAMLRGRIKRAISIFGMGQLRRRASWREGGAKSAAPGPAALNEPRRASVSSGIAAALTVSP